MPSVKTADAENAQKKRSLCLEAHCLGIGVSTLKELQYSVGSAMTGGKLSGL